MATMRSLIKSFDTAIDDALLWIGDHGGFVFDPARAGLEHLYHGVLWPFAQLPWPVTAIAFGILGWRLVGLRLGIGAALGLAACALMGLWDDTVGTLALVIAAMLLALAISLPLGVLAGFMPRLDRVLMPALDLIQTIPPYVYLLPAIALLGFGPATALIATVIVAVAPAIRLTSLGIRSVPVAFTELGQSVGAGPVQMFVKIRLPFALRSVMAG
ncbi:ABC transporter permease, partial [Pontibaca methylaminivorans]|uniref:ABC transporter permease n=1 Tax=Pontibaca methylaminivorans TaxID=515897 RepID=UPI002FD98998